MEKELDVIKMQKKLKKNMDEERYIHTVGVMYTCTALAMVHGVDLMQARVAGLLHDCAKCIPNEEKLKKCQEENIEISKMEEKNPFLLHAKLGAFVARKKYHIKDKEVLSAIRYHTTGCPEMTDLEKITFIADYIEPNRKKAVHLPQIRKMAFEDLDLCMYYILKDTLEYLYENHGDVDDTTEKAFQYYKRVIEERQ